MTLRALFYAALFVLSCNHHNHVEPLAEHKPAVIRRLTPVSR